MKKHSYKHLFIIIPVILILGILIGIVLFPEKIIQIDNTKNQTITAYKEISIVGVDSNGTGLTAKMLVEVKPGSGLVLVNINNVLADYLTQLSARTAARVASNYTNKSLVNLDVVYQIKANASIVEGLSAGVAMTLATIAALENKTINKDIFITGEIKEDGSIGEVGGIPEKSRAAKKNNASIFLIPNISYIIGYEEVKQCKQLETINYCAISYISKKADLKKIFNFNVIQVNNISEAVKYVIS